MEKKQKLELTWIGKDQITKLEPRILIEDSELSYHADKRFCDKDVFDNKLIYGDNLLALKALEQEYEGKIQCIYIDPPYNTGSAFEHYDDNLQHSIWLSLLKGRLEILWKLLSDSGLMAIQIDDNEYARLYLLLIEICGERNLKTISVKMSEPTGLKMASVLKNGSIPKLKEYIILAGKNGVRGLNIERIPKGSWDSEYKTLITNKNQDEIEFIKSVRDDENRTDLMIEEANAILATIQTSSLSDYFKQNSIVPAFREQFCFDNAWRIVQIASISGGAKNIADSYSAMHCNSAFFLIKTPQNKAYIIKNGYDTSVEVPRIKALFADDYLTVHPGDFWQDIKTTGLDNEGGVDFRNGKKPEALLKRIITMCTKKGDIVLDSFAGSGSTGAVAHKLGRRWIMVELGNHCHTHIIPRLKSVINGTDSGGITKVVDWKGGGGFRYYKLAPSLLAKDRWGNWVINKEYDANMLASAVCKQEGFVYSPSEMDWWSHGFSSETDNIFVTTQTLTEEQLIAISEEVGNNRTLLVCCSAYKAGSETLNNKLTNLTIKKMPNTFLSKCEWDRDDYSLNITNLPIVETEEIETVVASKKKKKTQTNAPDLFGSHESGE
jgi:adenine-specific DNA-methyltransferase